MIEAGVDETIPTQDERTLATLSHVLQLVGGWIAPLVILLVKRNSRFVSFHALQVLLLQGLYFLVVMIGGGVFFVVAIATITLHHPTTLPHQAGQHGAPPIWIIFSFLSIWLLMMGWWVFMLIMAIVYGIKAGRGEWARYPVLGPLSLKILKIGPNGKSSG